MSAWKKSFTAWCRVAPSAAPRLRLRLRDGAADVLTLARLAVASPGATLIVADDAAAAERLAAVLPTYLSFADDARTVTLVPEVDATRRGGWMPENEAARCAALDAALNGEPRLFIAPVGALLGSSVAPDAFAGQAFTLRTGAADWAPDALATHLVGLDYDHEFEVHAPGEFARRGGILDLFSPLYETPVRIEFFGNTIETMRFFLPDTQRSFAAVEAIRVVPRGAIMTAAPPAAPPVVADYFAASMPLVLCEPQAIGQHIERFYDAAAVARWAACAAAHRRIVELVAPGVEPLPENGAASAWVEEDAPGVSLADELVPALSELGDGAGLWHWHQVRDLLVRWHGQGFELVACCGGDGELERLADMLRDDGRTAGLPVHLRPERLDIGMFIAEARLVFLSERELFGRRPDVRRRRTTAYRSDYAVGDGMELEEGGFAVHAAQGICIYRGVRCLEVAGELQEVMDLEFDDEARLFVPLDQAHVVSRYVGGSKRMPRLSRLGGSAWKNAKASAAAGAWDMAAELVRLDAIRKQAKGLACGPADDWERTFAASFPYTETEDQTRAIVEILEDMAKPEPMDRLLCGDVGYGKTEVAMRAAFRAVVNGRQVAVLVPTTVLAQQHFLTFRERMAEYPVSIDMLSRFRSAGEQADVLERLALGRLDIVIGTHRLLQRDVLFANLGLLVIDEEQRFGVKHKQAFKRLRASIDILTMTATPIPRTLYFSLSGIRNLSTIMSAPAERLPITTVVAPMDWELVRQSIERELERHGQVYFLHNRVQTIERTAQALRQRLPAARFGIAHGQMPAAELEEVMARFIAGDIDVLVCTTIIESGLDIPNANTIIIDRADRFGLAELYQLRGRVGRYHNQAYAYLLLPPMGALPDNARQRLAAIRRYTHLGAGFKLALRDLEIRGAGNILGTEQSGHIAAVGFELYCELLQEAVRRLQQPADATAEPKERHIPVSLDSMVAGLQGAGAREVAAFTPQFVGDETARIELYRRLNGLRTLAEVDAFAEELADRFGPVPRAAVNCMQLGRVRILARAAGVHTVAVRDRRVHLETTHGFLKDTHGRIPRLTGATGAEQLAELLELLRAKAMSSTRAPVPERAGTGQGTAFGTTIPWGDPDKR